LEALRALVTAEEEKIVLQEENAKQKTELEYKNSIIILEGENVSPVEMKLKINRLVRDYATRTKIFYPFVWSELYTEFKYYYHTDLKLRCKGKKITKINMAENLGKLKELYSLAIKLFEVPKLE
jgi:hypothetical protein